MANDFDPLGARAIAQTVQQVVGSGLAVLNRVCLPVAEQIGLAAAEYLTEWRKRNLFKCMRKTEEMLAKNQLPEGIQAHPRVVNAIVQEMTWIEDPVVQDMWAGLLSSSCTPEGDDDSNLIFVSILSNMTKLQARIMNLSCEKSIKMRSNSGLIYTAPLLIPFKAFCEEVGETDVSRLDRELDSLRAMEVLNPIGSGLSVHSLTVVNLTPSALALHMFVRAKGSRLSPPDFFNLPAPPPPPSPQN